jgi:hypothetical protein
MHVLNIAYPQLLVNVLADSDLVQRIAHQLSQTRVSRCNPLAQQRRATVLGDRSDLAGELSREDHLQVAPTELLDGLGGSGQARTRGFLGLRRSSQALAEEKLDRCDPTPNIRDLDLDPLLLAAARAGCRDPRLPCCSKRGVEQRGRDVIERGSSGLGEARANLRRVGMTIPARESRRDLSDERVCDGALPPPRMVAVSHKFLSDLLDQAVAVSMCR